MAGVKTGRAFIAAGLLVVGARAFAETNLAEDDADPPIASEDRDTESLRLTPGEVFETRMGAEAAVQVSRRGIVDVFHAGGDRWTITGLRSGVALVEGREPTDQKTYRWLVRVENQASRRAEASFPAWICGQAGIRCRSELGLIEGTVESWDWYVRAHELCQKRGGCAFQVTLTPDGAAEAQRRLASRLGADHAIAPTADGGFIVHAPCDEEARPQRLQDLKDKIGRAARSGLVTIGCHADRGLKTFRLSAHIYQVEESTARRLGFAATVDGRVATSPANATGGSLSTLNALESERGVEVVGRPVVRLVPDQEVEIVSGGEFQTIEPRADGQDVSASWKQTGLTLKVRATPLGPDRARLSLSGALKSRRDNRSLAVSSIKSSLDARLGIPMLAASLDLESQEHQRDETPGLADLPILGVFFRLKGNDIARSRLLLWLEIAEDDGAAALPASLAPKTGDLP